MLTALDLMTVRAGCVETRELPFETAVQGVLLDRLMPDRKARILVEDVWLEDLLAQKPAG